MLFSLFARSGNIVLQKYINKLISILSFWKGSNSRKSKKRQANKPVK